MSPPETQIEREDARQNAAGVATLLDVGFGFFVWAAHFLAIYIATAVACQLGLGTSGAGVRATFQGVLLAVTVATAGFVVLHAVRRYRSLRDQADDRFRMRVTIGNDAIATIAIAWQLIAVSLVPLCA